MTFFYDLNKKLADLAKKQELNESVGSTSGFLEGSTDDYSSKKARAGKDIGKPGKMFSKIAKSAGERYGSKERGEKVAGAVLAKLRKGTKEAIDPSLEEADMEEGNEFSGELAKAKAAGAKSFKVDGKEYPVKEGAKPDYIDLDKDGNRKESMKKAAADAKKKKAIAEYDFDDKDDFDHRAKSGDRVKTSKGTLVKTDKGVRHERRHEEEPEADDEVSDKPKKKGRPAGTKRAIGAKGPSGKSKLLNKSAIKEFADEENTIGLIDKGEYDREGEMAKDDLESLAMAAKELHAILGDDENLPEWVQSKITKALDYINSSNQYMHQKKDHAEPVAEKAVSKAQQKFMGMVHAAQKGEKPASKAVAKVAKEMPKKAAKDFAATKHKGLPEKVKEADAEAKPAKKGGFEFGKGVYENMDRKFSQLLNEGMNVSVNMSSGPHGEPTKNITVSADGDDAEALAALLKMAGIGSNGETCSSCGKSGCGCEELDENSPDWPTNTETSDDAMQYSGGLNGPKSTGQTTVPVIASQLRRQVSMEESVELERSLFKLYQNYKAK